MLKEMLVKKYVIAIYCYKDVGDNIFQTSNNLTHNTSNTQSEMWLSYWMTVLNKMHSLGDWIDIYIIYIIVVYLYSRID